MIRIVRAAKSSALVKRIFVVAIAVALLHLAGVLWTASYVSHSLEGQAPLVWAYWIFIDLPWSLLPIESPLLVHGLIGTVWWCVLVVILSRAATNVVAFFRGRA
jgi:hypothetical protein